MSDRRNDDHLSDVAHFGDHDGPLNPGDNSPERTLCGLDVEGILWRNDTRADCKRCCDLWAARGWTFPLPELVLTPAHNPTSVNPGG